MSSPNPPTLTDPHIKRIWLYTDRAMGMVLDNPESGLTDLTLFFSNGPAGLLSFIEDLTKACSKAAHEYVCNDLAGWPNGSVQVKLDP